jgi:D-alanine-D-alanine ligase-like ATP-grasp enzyme
VRNLANGFVFQRNGIEVPEVVRQVARDTLLAVEGLTFGAVDVIFNERANRAYALEINTAPGLEGTTVDDYVTFFRGP